MIVIHFFSVLSCLQVKPVVPIYPLPTQEAQDETPCISKPHVLAFRSQNGIRRVMCLFSFSLHVFVLNSPVLASNTKVLSAWIIKHLLLFKFLKPLGVCNRMSQCRKSCVLVWGFPDRVGYLRRRPFPVWYALAITRRKHRWYRESIYRLFFWLVR